MKKMWRSDDDNLEELKSPEFPPEADVWPESLSRRKFLELATATLGAATLSGCIRGPLEKIVPYVDSPEKNPTNSLFYSTSLEMCGLASGLLVECHMGRPTKIEGHPQHPANLGAASIHQQAAILYLYGEERSRRVLQQGHERTWSDFSTECSILRKSAQKNQGRGLVFLTEATSSPSIESLMADLRKQFPQMVWHQYEPISHSRLYEATLNSFGAKKLPIYQFGEADVVVSFDADFLPSPLFPVTAARDFMHARRKNSARLFVIEPTPSLTGAAAHRRRAARASDIPVLASQIFESNDPFFQELSSAVRSSKTGCIFLAGENQSSETHRICFELNQKYGKGTTRYVQAPVANLESPSSLSDLQKLLESGQVESLFLVGGNPSYNTPKGFAAALSKAKQIFRLAVSEDETSQMSHWHLPLAHIFETWSDMKTFDGSISFSQPLIAPLFEGKSFAEVLSILQGEEKSSHQILQDFWRKKWASSFDSRWTETVRQGFVNDSKEKPETVSTKHLVTTPTRAKPLSAVEVEVIFRPDPTVWDGRFANNPWLQELPKPLSKVTWENVALLSPALAQNLKIENGRKIKIAVSSGELTVPAWIMPGQEERTITLTFGYGRTHAGKVGSNIGYNAFAIWDGAAATTGHLTVLNEKTEIASTQSHNTIDSDELIKFFDSHSETKPLSIYTDDPDTPRGKYAWGMTIDLDSCIGCSACVVACQSENNIPVVGKTGVLLGREMQWIRVDRYFSGEKSQPEMHFQPVPCMQCEKAPCEVVCPVAATSHTSEGLNQMVYNRCIGTRYCSNNCPYKVRRFNFLSYNSGLAALEKMQKNPDVSVRSRGVMEKCTYCVQRIEKVKIKSQVEDRPIQDLEIKTACQATCPTQAITFGDLNDPKSQVRKAKSDPRNYSLLDELGTRPRTTYLAKIKEVHS